MAAKWPEDIGRYQNEIDFRLRTPVAVSRSIELRRSGRSSRKRQEEEGKGGGTKRIKAKERRGEDGGGCKVALARESIGPGDWHNLFNTFLAPTRFADEGKMHQRGHDAGLRCAHVCHSDHGNSIADNIVSTLALATVAHTARRINHWR